MDGWRVLRALDAEAARERMWYLRGVPLVEVSDEVRGLAAGWMERMALPEWAAT